MSEHLEAAAAAIGAPAELVERSAAARAQASGASVDDILAAWAGGGSAPAAGSAPAPAAAQEEAPPAETEAAAPSEAEPVAAPAPTAEAAAPMAAAPAAAVSIEAVPIPDTVSVEESLDWDMVTSVGSAGLKERTRSVIPNWVMGFFVLIPLFAIGYLFTSGEGATCGEGGQLAVDFRNDLVNCDLSAYEGFGGPGSGSVNYVALGSVVYGQCASCHGPDGGGVGNFPRLSGGSVLETFGSCSDHLTWVELGSLGWQAEFGATYGDTNKPSVNGMPGFVATLTPEELASVVLYERVVFGGADTEEALVDCGLVEEDPVEGEEDPVEGEEPTTEAATLR